MTFKKATKGKVGMTVIYSGDSSVRIKKDGTLAWRNNNPGNIVCGFRRKVTALSAATRVLLYFRILRQEGKPRPNS